MTETDSREAATQLFLDDCKAFKRDPDSFIGPVVSGPNKLEDGSYWFSYEWKHKSGEWITLITVKDDGEMNLSR